MVLFLPHSVGGTSCASGTVVFVASALVRADLQALKIICVDLCNCNEQLLFPISFFRCLQFKSLLFLGSSESLVADTMTNWHDPVLAAAEGCSSSSLFDTACHLSLPYSPSHQAYTRPCWRVHVGSLVRSPYVGLAAHLTSWEFVLNLDYEYSIITKKRKFGLSVPVRSSSA
jgi:hypothetical protein